MPLENLKNCELDSCLCTLHHFYPRQLCARCFARGWWSRLSFCFALVNIRCVDEIDANITDSFWENNSLMPQTTEFLRSLEVLNVAGMLKPHLKNLNLSCCPVCVFLRPHYASVASFLRYAKGCLPRLPTSQPLRRTKDAINVFVESVAVFFARSSLHPIFQLFGRISYTCSG